MGSDAVFYRVLRRVFDMAAIAIVLLGLPLAAPGAEYDVLGASGLFETDSDRNGAADGWWLGGEGDCRRNLAVGDFGAPNSRCSQMISVTSDTGRT